MTPEVFDRVGEIGLRVLVAVAVLVVGRVFAGLGRRLVNRLTSRPKVARNVGPSMRSFLARAIYVVAMVLALLVALAVVGVPNAVLVWGVGIVLIVLSVALSRSLENLAATVIFIIFRPFQLGDDVETMGVRGVVEDIQLFNTLIRQFDHSMASLPNGAIQNAGVINHSRTGINWAAIDLTVSYGEDLVKVQDLIRTELVDDPRVLATPPPDVVVLRLGTEGVVFQAQPTVRHEDLWPALSDLQGKITARLQEEGIDLAVPPELPVRIHRWPTPSADDRR
ncbi:MAG TPA: mechanosensitive ion channel domain-containing protein [Acidimicrobiia bacterium]|jgi:small conductance mechanosensitive channel